MLQLMFIIISNWCVKYRWWTSTEAWEPKIVAVTGCDIQLSKIHLQIQMIHNKHKTWTKFTQFWSLSMTNYLWKIHLSNNFEITLDCLCVHGPVFLHNTWCTECQSALQMCFAVKLIFKFTIIVRICFHIIFIFGDILLFLFTTCLTVC